MGRGKGQEAAEATNVLFGAGARRLRSDRQRTGARLRAELEASYSKAWVESAAVLEKYRAFLLEDRKAGAELLQPLVETLPRRRHPASTIFSGIEVTPGELLWVLDRQDDLSEDFGTGIPAAILGIGQAVGRAYLRRRASQAAWAHGASSAGAAPPRREPCSSSRRQGASR